VLFQTLRAVVGGVVLNTAAVPWCLRPWQPQRFYGPAPERGRRNGKGNKSLR
jgi:hypothetical protein